MTSSFQQWCRSVRICGPYQMPHKSSVPGGHLAKFPQMVESGPSFWDVVLRGSLEGKTKWVGGGGGHDREPSV